MAAMAAPEPIPTDLGARQPSDRCGDALVQRGDVLSRQRLLIGGVNLHQDTPLGAHALAVATLAPATAPRSATQAVAHGKAAGVGPFFRSGLLEPLAHREARRH